MVYTRSSKVSGDDQSEEGEPRIKALLSLPPSEIFPSDPIPFGLPRPSPIGIPLFSGENFSQWLLQIEDFFYYNFISPEWKLFTASFYLAGEPLQFLYGLQYTDQLSTWEKFIDQLELRFGAVIRPTIVVNIWEACDFESEQARSNQQLTLSKLDFQKELEDRGNSFIPDNVENAVDNVEDDVWMELNAKAEKIVDGNEKCDAELFYISDNDDLMLIELLAIDSPNLTLDGDNNAMSSENSEINGSKTNENSGLYSDLNSGVRLNTFVVDPGGIDYLARVKMFGVNCVESAAAFLDFHYGEICFWSNLLDSGGVENLCSVVSSISPRIRVDNDLEASTVTDGEWFLIFNGELNEFLTDPMNLNDCLCVVGEYAHLVICRGKSVRSEACLILNSKLRGKWLGDLSELKICGFLGHLKYAIVDVLDAIVTGTVFVHLLSKNFGINDIVGEPLNFDVDDFVYAETRGEDLVNELTGDAFRVNLFSSAIGLNMCPFDPGGLESIIDQLNVEETIMVKKEEEIPDNLHFDVAGLNSGDDVRKVHEYWSVVVTCFRRITMVLQIQQHCFLIFVRLKLFKQMVSQTKLANCLVEGINFLGFSACVIKFIANHKVYAIEFDDSVMSFWIGTLHTTFFIEERDYCKASGITKSLFQTLKNQKYMCCGSVSLLMYLNSIEKSDGKLISSVNFPEVVLDLQCLNEDSSSISDFLILFGILDDSYVLCNLEGKVSHREEGIVMWKLKVKIVDTLICKPWAELIIGFKGETLVGVFLSSIMLSLVGFAFISQGISECKLSPYFHVQLLIQLRVLLNELFSLSSLGDSWFSVKSKDGDRVLFECMGRQYLWIFLTFTTQQPEVIITGSIHELKVVLNSMQFMNQNILRGFCSKASNLGEFCAWQHHASEVLGLGKPAEIAVDLFFLVGYSNQIVQGQNFSSSLATQRQDSYEIANDCEDIKLRGVSEDLDMIYLLSEINAKVTIQVSIEAKSWVAYIILNSKTCCLWGVMKKAEILTNLFFSWESKFIIYYFVQVMKSWKVWDKIVTQFRGGTPGRNDVMDTLLAQYYTSVHHSVPILLSATIFSVSWFWNTSIAVTDAEGNKLVAYKSWGQDLFK